MDEEDDLLHPVVAVGQLTTANIESVPTGTTAEEISRSGADWVVLRGSEGEILGVIRPATAAEAPQDESIDYLARRTDFAIVPADLELGNLGRPIAAEAVEVASLVIAVEQDEPIGVWAGQSQYILLGTDVSKITPSGIVIGESATGLWAEVAASSLIGPGDGVTLDPVPVTPFTAECQYSEDNASNVCGWIWSFVFAHSRECANPRGFQPHDFVLPG
ncbi:hypothetical protein [Mycolicibacterium pallens]|uniref:CBS domain-containing protein n=1 Tax=Mycolicibacterium pallens TaxID=370524 RepID=A0ABX8VQI3_9MYCO|nr:hypothetical protein [Mycolicibacterium pallens]QYL17766.1 hypothetical protein K0O64_04170 [Mycolicibacterium pallens]